MFWITFLILYRKDKENVSFQQLCVEEEALSIIPYIFLLLVHDIISNKRRDLI